MPKNYKILKSLIGIYAACLLSGNFANPIASSDMNAIRKEEEVKTNLRLLNKTFQMYRKASYECERKLNEYTFEEKRIENFPFKSEKRRERFLQDFLEGRDLKDCYESREIGGRINYFFMRFPEMRNMPDAEGLGTLINRWQGIRKIFDY